MKEKQKEIQQEPQQEQQKRRLSLKWVVIKLTGLLFAAYSAYNVFVIFRDREELPLEGTIITAFVALLFALLAVFAWTTEAKHILFVLIRRTVFILSLLALFALKMNLVVRVVHYLDFSVMHTVLYAGAYFLTQAGFLVLFVYYVFILKYLPHYPKLSVIVPLAAILFFLGALVVEAVLFFGFWLGMEATWLRTVVIRPVFYLGFIGLSVYFLFPLEQAAEEEAMEQESLL